MFLINITGSSIVERLLELLFPNRTLFHISLKRLQGIICSQGTVLLVLGMIVSFWSLPKLHTLHVDRREINRFFDALIIILVISGAVSPCRSNILFNFRLLGYIRNIRDDISIQVGRLILVPTVHKALHGSGIGVFSHQSHLH